MRILQKDVNYVRRVIEQAGLFAEVWSAKTSVAVRIEWGDVREDHTKCVRVLENKGFEQSREVVTEEDEISPLYSSIHYFKKLRH